MGGGGADAGSGTAIKTNSETMKRISEMKQLREKLNQPKNGVPRNMKYLKQKKTVKRTYRLGKSKVFNKVSVLVSNKTIRKNVANKTQQIKETPIHEVRNYLVKKGFIKVGSTAPNDVLRKMYESAMLIGGEIQNHNIDNLLYNYLNGDK
jgi:hypothetical protein